MKIKFREMTFQTKVFIFSLLICSIALFIFAVIVSRLLTDSILTNSTQSAVNELNLLNQNTCSLISRVEDHVDTLSVNQKLQSTMSKYLEDLLNSDDRLLKSNLSFTMSGILSNTISPTSQFLGCVIFCNNDVVYVTSNLKKCNVEDYISADHLAKVSRTKKAVWQTDLFHLKPAAYNKEINVLAISKQIIDKSTGKSLGIITLLLDENSISSLLPESTGDNFYFINEDRLISSCTDDDYLYSYIDSVLPVTDAQFQELSDSKHVLITVPASYKQKSDSEDSVFSSKSKSALLTGIYNDTLKWTLLRYTDLSILEKDQHNIRNTFILILISTVLAVLVMLWFMSRYLTKPLNRLLLTMEEIDGQHIDLRAPDDLPGEIGILAKNFNALMDKLETSIQEIEDSQKIQRANELRILQEQIKPHFLYNALQMIVSLINIKEYSLASDGIFALSDFYKYSLNSGNSIISIRDESYIIEKYLQIQHLRYSDFFEYYIDIDESIRDYCLPKLTLQPLIENAIYHGIKPSCRKGMLMVSGYETADSVILEVSDSGVGMDEDQIENINNGIPLSSTSFGLYNVLQRLRLLYSDSVRISASSVKNEYSKIAIEIDHPKTLFEVNHDKSSYH